MGYNGAPVTVTGAVITALNPSKNLSSQPAVAAQVANSSPWLVNVQTQNGVMAIQPYTATSVPVAVGQDMVITPALQVYNVTGGYVQLYWMIAGEHPPQPDGPLTAAATIAGALISTTTTLRSLGTLALANGLVSGSINLTGAGLAPLQPTDRYLLIVNSGSGSGLWLRNAQGSGSGIVVPVNDVASDVHWGTVPLTGLDTNILISWVSLPAVTTGNPTFAVFASSAPLPQVNANGLAKATTAAAASLPFTWLNAANAAPLAIRLQSASIMIHNPAATAQAVIGWVGTGVEIYRAGAALNGEQVPSRTFGKGIIICNGALADGTNDYSPASLRFVTTAASTASQANIDYEILALN